MNAHHSSSDSVLLPCQYCGRKTLGQAPDKEGVLRGLCPVNPCLDEWADAMHKAYEKRRFAS
jgi:hypothetical protein